MRRRIKYNGLKKTISDERLARLNRAWGYMNLWQRVVIYARVVWHSSSTLYQTIEHIKYFYLRWLETRLYPAHWVK